MSNSTEISKRKGIKYQQKKKEKIKKFYFAHTHTQTHTREAPHPSTKGTQAEQIVCYGPHTETRTPFFL